MFDGQFYPFQPIQFMDGLLNPIIGINLAMEITFVNSAISSTASITIPSDAAAGDIAVFYDQGTNGNNGVPTKVSPPSWTELSEATQNTGATDARLNCFYKILAGGEPGTSISGITTASTTTTRKIMFVFRPSMTITTVTPSTWVAQSKASAPTNQTISASGQATPLIALAFVGGRSGTNIFNTESPAFASLVDSTALCRGGYTIYNTSPSNHTVGKSGTGDANLLTSGYLIIS